MDGDEPSGQREELVQKVLGGKSRMERPNECGRRGERSECAAGPGRVGVLGQGSLAVCFGGQQ